MNKKNGSIKLSAGIFIIILAFLVVGGLWMSTKQEAPSVEPEETKTKDEVWNFLENLKQETGIDFSAIADVEFDWMVEKDKKMERVTIQGRGFEADEIPSEQYSRIESFLKAHGFEADIYNAAAGTISGLDGYRKDYLVCIVVGGVTGYKEATGQWTPPETDKQDVEIKCGQGDSSIDPVISKEEAIKRFLAQKYQTKASAINIDISQETVHYVKCGIQVLDEFAQGGAGDKGIFLVAKVDENWQIIEEKEKYYFPEDKTIATKNNDDFFVILEANPTTGYQWEVDFDSDYLELTNREYVTPSSGLVGAGGDETFNFLALKSGQTEITFSYLRSWEKDISPIEEKIYQITIE